MCAFDTFLAVGILGLAVGCGGSSSNSTGACNYPSCLASLSTACAPSGTCVDQMDATTGLGNSCYSNGVKVLTTYDSTSQNIVATIKNPGGTCYTFNVGMSAAGASTYAYVIKNASGQAVATGTRDAAGTTIITCTAGQPVTLNSSCDTATLIANSNCTPGTCTP